MKLRDDVARAFQERVANPPRLEPERVRHETKHVLDLAVWAPDRVRPEAVIPDRTCLCLLQRTGKAATTMRHATGAEVAAATIANSLFYDSEATWRRNVDRIAHLLRDAECIHLEAGTDTQGLVAVLQDLAGLRRLAGRRGRIHVKWQATGRVPTGEVTTWKVSSSS